MAEVSGDTIASSEYMEVTFTDASGIMTTQTVIDNDDDEIEYGAAFKPSQGNVRVRAITSRNTSVILV